MFYRLLIQKYCLGNILENLLAKLSNRQMLYAIQISEKGSFDYCHCRKRRNSLNDSTQKTDGRFTTICVWRHRSSRLYLIYFPFSVLYKIPVLPKTLLLLLGTQ